MSAPIQSCYCKYRSEFLEDAEQNPHWNTWCDWHGWPAICPVAGEPSLVRGRLAGGFGALLGASLFGGGALEAEYADSGARRGNTCKCSCVERCAQRHLCGPG